MELVQFLDSERKKGKKLTEQENAALNAAKEYESRTAKVSHMPIKMKTRNVRGLCAYPINTIFNPN